MKLDTLLLSRPADAATQARFLADTGIDGLFSVEGVNDPFTGLTVAATAVDVDLYTNIAVAFPRSPMTTAYQSWDLQGLTGGRFSLGLGTQVRANVERRYGATWSNPVERMREFVTATKAIFDCWQHGTRLDFRGEHYTHTLMQPTFNPGAVEGGPPPVLVGALGPRMTRMATEVADGILLHPFTTERYLRDEQWPRVDEGLHDTGRSKNAFTVVCEAIVCTGRDEDELAEAEAGVRGLLAFYGSTPAYRAPLELHGYGDLQPELNRLAKEGRWDEMTGLIDDDLLRTFAVHGSPAEVGAEAHPPLRGDGRPHRLLPALRRAARPGGRDHRVVPRRCWPKRRLRAS
ncbi:MAG: TIGR03617 family F420-dependent LLM class oxidoreductase [Acidimicrobiia bacterium]|nr:TIGR03617 family F420-dependent LLM class oxidoreductase [Acidimicrobiia bacterium]